MSSKIYEKPCLKCMERRGFTYTLTKDWFTCTICQQSYSSDVMDRVRPNFTYPATAAWLKSNFPFFVASAYPKEYQYQMVQKKWEEQQAKQKAYYSKAHYQAAFKAEHLSNHYREKAKSEFEGVEELDPSLWTDAGDAGLL